MEETKVLKSWDNKFYVCPKCGQSRWKTKKKGKEYQCRKCGYINKN